MGKVRFFLQREGRNRRGMARAANGAHSKKRRPRVGGRAKQWRACAACVRSIAHSKKRRPVKGGAEKGLGVWHPLVQKLAWCCAKRAALRPKRAAWCAAAQCLCRAVCLCGGGGVLRHGFGLVRERNVRARVTVYKIQRFCLGQVVANVQHRVSAVWRNVAVC